MWIGFYFLFISYEWLTINLGLKKKQQVLPTAIRDQIICFLGSDMLDRLYAFAWFFRNKTDKTGYTKKRDVS